MALGANPAGLMWFILRGTISLIVFAIVIGVTGSFLSSSLLSSFLFGIQPVDPWVYAATTALLVAIGLLARRRTCNPRAAHRPRRHAALALTSPTHSRTAQAFIE